MAMIHILVQLVNNSGFQARCINSFKWFVATRTLIRIVFMAQLGGYKVHV